ncbi:MAG: terminase small subunit [Bryobacteraceae bacterium]
MPVLTNPRHEHFAQLIAGGKTPTEAYIVVGYSKRGAHASANRLRQNATVAARLDELRSAVAERTIEKTAIDRAWVIGRLQENVERAMQHRPVLDSSGKETGEYRYEGAVANRALELLGKELGMFVDRNESKIAGSLDLIERLNAGRKRLADLADSND